jgi:hypothetical protein
MPQENLTRESVLGQTMDELGTLRQAVLALPDQSQVRSAMEAIAFYERELPGITNLFELHEFCARAIADIHHEVAAAEYGFESPEAEAVFDERDRELSECLRTIWAARNQRVVA